MYSLIQFLHTGLSMVQGGPMPSFFPPETVQKFIQENTDVTASETQLRDGLKKIGIIQV